jgi:endonuclease YncB( thermonuclease family)
MRFLLLGLLALLTSLGAQASEATFNRSLAPLVVGRGYHALGIQVIDGDSVRISRKQGPKGLIYSTSQRFWGFDAPELHIACEAEQARAAKAFLVELMSDPRFVVIRPVKNRRDKYGRQLITASVINFDKSKSGDIADLMVKGGFAHRYTGGTRPAWPQCAANVYPNTITGASVVVKL